MRIGSESVTTLRRVGTFHSATEMICYLLKEYCIFKKETKVTDTNIPSNNSQMSGSDATRATATDDYCTTFSSPFQERRLQRNNRHSNKHTSQLSGSRSPILIVVFDLIEVRSLHMNCVRFEIIFFGFSCVSGSLLPLPIIAPPSPVKGLN